MTSRERMLERLQHLSALPFTDPGTYLHLGCGPKILPGFTNVDAFHAHPEVLRADIGEELPFAHDSVDAIYSSHALEHLPVRKARKALRIWAALLRPEGKLFLAVPDLAEICRIMIDPAVPDDLRWNWYVYTLFGYQIDSNIGWQDRSLDHPVDRGQFHMAGFTLPHLRTLLEADNGLTVVEAFGYDGWGTPSLWVEAAKPARQRR